MFITCLLLINKFDLISSLKFQTNSRLSKIGQSTLSDTGNDQTLNHKDILIKNKANGLCITMKGENKGLVFTECHGAKDQLWINTFMRREKAYEIKNSYNADLVIENQYNRDTDDNLFFTSLNKFYTGPDGQRFFEIESKTKPGFYLFKNYVSWKCITFKEQNDKLRQLVQYPCNRDDETQLFSFKIFDPKKVKNVNTLSGNNLVIKPKTALGYCAGSDMSLAECWGLPTQLWINELKDNSYQIMNQVDKDKFISIKYGSPLDDSIIWTYESKNEQTRFFEVESKSFPGFYYLKNVYSRKCITYKNDPKANFPFVQFSCDKNNELQLFSIEKYEYPNLETLQNKDLEFVSKSNGLCVTLQDANKGLIFKECHGTLEQLWINTLKRDKTYLIINALNVFVGNDELVFEIKNNGRENNVEVLTKKKLPPAGNNIGQQFLEFESHTKPGFYLFKSVVSGKCITVVNEQLHKDSKLVQSSCNPDDDNQLFNFRKFDVTKIANVPTLSADGVEIVLKANGLCVGAGDSGEITLLKCVKNKGQLWSNKYEKKTNSYEIYNGGRFPVKFDNRHGRLEDNNGLWIYPETSGKSQRYYEYESTKYPWFYRFKNLGNRKCLTFKKIHDPKFPLTHWPCDENDDDQLFSIGGSNNNNIDNPTPLTPPKDLLTLKGFVKDATNNQVLKDSELSDVKVTFTNVETKKNYTAIINNSIYSVSLPAGKYELVISSKNFIGSTSNVEFTKSSDENNLPNTILLSRVFKGWRFVLTWAALPKDLDLIAETSEEEKIYYKNKLSADGNIVLDVDAREGYGPETMTVKDITSEKVILYAKNYSNDALLSDSKGKFVVYNDSRVAAVLEVPKGEKDQAKDIWFIGTLEKNNKFTIVNRIGDEYTRWIKLDNLK